MATDALRNDAERFSDRRRAWLLGGSLLLASTIVDFVVRPWLFAMPGSGLVGDILYALALLVFAFGLRGQGSITARRPLGTTALVVLAVWSFVHEVVFGLMPIDPSNMGPAQVLGATLSLLQGAIALIAVVQIGRAHAVQRPWNWAPAWALGAVAASTVLQFLVFAGGTESQEVLGAVVAVDLLARVGGSTFLGVLAIVLANWPAPTRTVSIIDSES